METESTLLNAARSMDKDALVQIFDLYSGALFKYTLRLVSDPVLADEIVGDVFVKLLEQISAGNGPTSNLRSYLYETTYHRIIDEVRHSKRRVPLEVLEWLVHDSDSEFQRLENRIVFEQVMHVIRNELTDDQRHVIILRFLEEFSLRETAAIIGKQVGHVKVIQNRALAKLRQSSENKSIEKPVYSASLKVPKMIGV